MPDGSPLANVSSFDAFANNVGTATLNADQTTINYNVGENASGTDIFTYTAQDESGQNSQLAYIVVVVNEPHAPILELSLIHI